MSSPKLHLVSKPAIPIPFDGARGLKLIDAKRAQLLAAVIRYVREGKDGKPVERLNIASDRSGIPRGLIEAEMRK